MIGMDEYSRHQFAKILANDPFALKHICWPRVRFYDKQREIVESTYYNTETYVPAGNMLGKDFVAGYIAISTFLRAYIQGKTCRIVTTSVAEHHLKVLWGEIGRFVSSSAYPLLYRKGGPLVENYQEIRRASEAESKNPLNYLVGRVSATGEGMAGHHAEITLAIIDEASGVDQMVYDQIATWAKRILIIGNCNDCAPTHFFRAGVMAGDLLAEDLTPKLRAA